MRQELSLNDGWRFRREEQVSGGERRDMFGMFTENTKTGGAAGVRSDGYYDGDWQRVSLPHDWCVGAKFVSAGGVQGAKPRGAAWYRRCFRADPTWEGKRVFLRFDGIAVQSEVWLNSVKLADSESGYTPVSAEITELLRYGDGNVLAVRATNQIQEGWWYEGCGIYRDVWLTVTEPVRLAEDGVFVSAVPGDAGAWRLRIRAEVDGNAEGCMIAAACLGQTVQVAAQAETECTLTVPNPPLWSPEEPTLIPVSVMLLRNGETADQVTVPFGFRTVRFDPDTGCSVNGKPVKLKGCCLHHDHAGVGAAVTYPIQRYRLEKLRQMGCNAIRTSHNPQSPDFYRACDELGILVMDETRHFSSTKEVLAQLRAFVRRDRNHPCVVMWSLFNEEPLQCTPVGERIARTMKAEIARLDGTRPVTGGMNGALEPEGAVKVVDLMGFNYLQYGYDAFHQAHPTVPVFGSENSSWRTCRGETENKPEEGRKSCWGRQYPVNLHDWSDTPGGTWREIESRPYVAGGFEWTGIDYRGENTWPAVVSDFGALDLCGFEKDGFWWHRALWLDTPQLKLSPKWDWPEGTEAVIIAYSNCDTVELLRNGVSLGEHPNDRYDPELWHVPYEPGTLTALGRIGGKLVCSDTLRTPGSAGRLRLVPSRDILEGPEAVLLDVTLLDQAGTVLPDTDAIVCFEVAGGRVAGVGNGDNASHDSELGGERRLFHGRCQAVLLPDGPGELTVTARCGSLCETVTISVGTRSVAGLPEAACRLTIAPWRMSDVKPSYPPLRDILSQRVNWIPTTVGGGKSLMLSGKRGFASVTGTFSVPRDAKDSLTVILERVQGGFDLYLDEEKVLAAPDGTDRGYEIPCPKLPEGKTVTVALVFRLTGGDCGVCGGAYLRCGDQ